MEKSKLKKLFSGMSCSICGHDFDENAIKIIRREKNLLVLKIICPECGKNFGIALLGTNENNSQDYNNDDYLEFKPCPLPISYDDVLDAHNFIDKLEKDWTKFIPKNLKD